jgi:hypothetical protein
MTSEHLFSTVWKTGNRVPVDGIYVDQFGTQTNHSAHRTFPPCVGNTGNAAYRRLVRVTKLAA